MQSTPIDLDTGSSNSDKAGWRFGIWELSDSRRVWGLLHRGFETHMCYGFDYANPWIGIRRRRKIFKSDPDEAWLRWYFDVGRRIFCSLDELERCLLELGETPNYKGT